MCHYQVKQNITLIKYIDINKKNVPTIFDLDEIFVYIFIINIIQNKSINYNIIFFGGLYEYICALNIHDVTLHLKLDHYDVI